VTPTAATTGTFPKLPASPLGALRVAVLVAVVGISAWQILLSVAIIPSLDLDTDAYWDAALRLRSGEPLYVASGDILARDVYRYSPWFAYAWIPLTYLPRHAVEAVWSAAMVACTVIAVIPLLARRTLASFTVAMLIGWLTLQTALFGNVQPLLIAGLVWTVDRRAGPIWIAVAASLKFVPILYVVVYLSRGEWCRAAVTVACTVALVAPIVAFDLSGYTAVPGHTLSLYSVHPVLWVVVAVGALGVAAVLATRRSPHAWLAASAAVILAYPQAHLSYASHLLVGTRRDRRTSASRAGAGVR
jgi:hypothetical protein